MFSQVYSATICGAKGKLILVEADVSHGFPSYTMVGYLASEVREARERVITSLKNAGIAVMTGRIIVNLSPAGIRKEGTAYDLSIAAAILTAMQIVPEYAVKNTMILGELSLDGTVRGIRGVLPMLCEAKEQGITRCIVPRMNLKEASLVSGMKILGVSSLNEMIGTMKDPEAYRDAGRIRSEDVRENNSEKIMRMIPGAATHIRDFEEICGQEMLKKAIQTAVAGHHHMLMIGAPGSGKSLAASCIPSILPEMTEEEQMEVTKMYSIAGLLNYEHGLIRQRPFRQPHHSVTMHALVGGGNMPRPGEISLAHKGVLFLDEFAEFSSEAIEALRQPLENQRIMIDRVHGNYIFPGDFMLVAAMNPCPCGYYPDRQRCRCSNQKIRRYLGKISGPILDRFDIGIEVRPVNLWKTEKDISGMTSLQMKAAVDKAWKIQKERFQNTSILYNSQIPAVMFDLFCPRTEAAETMLRDYYESEGMSMRGYHKLVRTSRTIADLEGSGMITEGHVAEALYYRGISHSYWNGEQVQLFGGGMYDDR